MAFDLRRAQPTRPGLLSPVAGAIGVLIIAIGLLVGFGSEWLQNIDNHVTGSLSDFSRGRSDFVSVMKTMSWLLGPTALVLVLAVAAVFAWHRREHRIAFWIVVTAIVERIANPLLKLAFGRDRPSDSLVTIGGSSFPSGHSDAAGMFVMVAILLTIVLTGRGWRRRLIITLWVLLGLAVGISRILLGVHYLSDVIAGLAVGVLIALISWLTMMGGSVPIPRELAAHTGTGKKRVAVIFNPIKVGDPEIFKERVRTVAAREGWVEPKWWETTVEDPGRGQSHEALAAGIDLVVAAGGDGTIREVCAEAARTGIAVGILPHGTGNLLARNLGVPLNIKDAIDTVFAGQDRAIDLANYSSEAQSNTIFMVMAGMGLDAAIMTGVDDQLKSRVGWLAYFVSGLKASRFPAMKVQISVDDGEFRKFRARTVVVGNVGYLQGGIPLMPEAQIDDGLLDVVVIAPKRFLGWLAIIVRVISRQKRTNERLGRMTGRKVVVRTDKPSPMQLDGDAIGEGTELSASIEPGVLLVRVPLAPPPPS